MTTTGPQPVEVELKYSPSQLRLLVRDDGSGIEPQILNAGRDGHWGLSGMRERAEEIGARLRLFSSAAVGTEVELSVPAHVAFEGHSRGGLRRFVLPNGILKGIRRPEAEKGRKK